MTPCRPAEYITMFAVIRPSILRMLVDNSHPGAECGEHRCVLDADHACTDHDHGAGYPPHPQPTIGAEHMVVVELDLR